MELLKSYVRNKLFLLLALTPFVLNARIIESSSIDEAVTHFMPEAWIMVDLDHTLFQAKQSEGHLFWIYNELDKHLEMGMTREEAITAIYPSWIESQKQCPVETLEASFVPHLLALQRKGAIVMGFTQRPPEIAESTAEQVLSLGINFLSTAPSQETFFLPFRHSALYSNGILFASDYNTKGEVLSPFFKRINKIPAKVVMIDDKRKNLEDIEAVLAELKVEYLGIHYTAIQHVKSNYTP